MINKNIFYPSVNNGFTLIEVLVAFAIMAFLLSSILNAEINTIYVINTTEKRIEVMNVVRLELGKISRNSIKYTDGIIDGEFEDVEDRLFGDKFQIRTETIQVFQIPIKKISYEIFWFEGEVEKSLSSYVLAPP